MAQMANIVAFDGAATPVAHTFYPVSVEKEKGEVVALWREQQASLPIYAQGTVTMKLKRLASGVYRVSSRVEIPVMESISGQNAAGYTAAPKVAYVDTHETVGYFHERSSIANRRTVRQLGVNIGNNVTTSVAANAAGPLPELFDLLVAPN